MKTSIKTIAATIALTALMAGSAAAAVSVGNIIQDVNYAAGTGSNVFVTVNDNIATLTGQLENASDRYTAINAAKSNAGIERVIDLTSVSD